MKRFWVLLLAALPLLTWGATPGAGTKADANTVNAGPASGSPALPTYRALTGQDVAQAVAVKTPVRVATTTSGTLATSFENGDTIDSITLATGDRILLKNQASASENGIYVVAASGAPTRATDADASGELPVGLIVSAKAGSTNAGKLFVMMASADPVVVNTSNLTFTEISGAGGVSDGDKGDIVVSGSGTTFTIDSSAVNFTKFQNITTDRLLGRDTTASGVVEEIAVGGGLEFTGSVGIQRSALTGDVTATAGSNATTIANNAVTTAKIADSNVTTAKIADSNVTTAKIADANVTTAKINDSAVTYAKLNTELKTGAFVSRNLILNGDCVLDQMNEGAAYTVSVVTATHTLDGWFGTSSSNASLSITRSTTVPSSDSFTNSIQHTVTNADTSLASTDRCVIGTRIEGYDAAELQNKSFTFSFWVRSPKTGTHCVAFRNLGTTSGFSLAANRSYVAEYSVSSAGTWERKSITVSSALPTGGGTWNFTNGIGLEVTFALHRGSNFETTAGSWQTGDYHCTSNQVNVCDAVSNDFLLTGVQLVAGSVDVPYHFESIGERIRRARRYFRKTIPIGTAVAANSGGTGALRTVAVTNSITAARGCFVRWDFNSTPMRATPTITTYNPQAAASSAWWGISAGATGPAATSVDTSIDGTTIGNNAAPTSGDAYYIHATADARL